MSKRNAYTLLALSSTPDKTAELNSLIEKQTPPFLLKGDTFHWPSLYKELADWQIALLDTHNHLVACGVCVPIYWNGNFNDLPSSLENIILSGVLASPAQYNTLVPIGVYVDSTRQGEGLSKIILEAMKQLARSHNKKYMVIPLRPILKHLYPLHDIADYAKWKLNAEAFDPWLRTHLRMGAKILGTVESTVTVKGKIAQWENLLNMSLPVSGKYIIPQGMSPLEVSAEEKMGIYRDPNIWIEHPLRYPPTNVTIPKS